jgi:hypothetical protein
MTRFRPVLLTAVTTALGLVPLAIGLNFDFFGLYTSLNPDLFWGGEQAAWWSSMAIAVIVGIIVATALTLIVVPVMYSLVDDMVAFFRRHFVGEPAVAVATGVVDARTNQGLPDLRPQPSPQPEGEPAMVRKGFRSGDLASDHG